MYVCVCWPQSYIIREPENHYRKRATATLPVSERDGMSRFLKSPLVTASLVTRL